MTRTPENQPIIDTIGGNLSSNIKNYNTVFRQAANNLIIGAGILLALSTQLVGQAKDASLPIRILSTLIVVSLSLSIAFGIIQQLMEAAYFRRLAMKHLDLIDKVNTTSLKNPERIRGNAEAISESNGKAVKRWPLAVQLILLAVSLALIIAVTTVYLF